MLALLVRAAALSVAFAGHGTSGAAGDGPALRLVEPALELKLAAHILCAAIHAVGAGPDLRTRSARLSSIALASPAPRSTASSDDDPEPGLPRVPHREASAGVPSRRAIDARRLSPEAEPAEPEAKHTRVAPWIGLGGSAALGVAGAIFFSKTADLLSQDPTKTAQALSTAVPNPTATATAVRQQEHDIFVNGMLATVFISGAIAGLVTSLLLLSSD